MNKNIFRFKWIIYFELPKTICVVCLLSSMNITCNMFIDQKFSMFIYTSSYIVWSVFLFVLKKRQKISFLRSKQLAYGCNAFIWQWNIQSNLTTCLMWPYFIVRVEGHIRQVWLYISLPNESITAICQLFTSQKWYFLSFR
jgi:hypothetical protein